MELRLLTISRLLAVSCLSVIALAGCGGGPGDQTSATPSADKNTAREYAQCMRANGHPDFPDAVADDHGILRLPAEAETVTPPAACTDQARAYKAYSRLATDTGRNSAENMEKLRSYTKCMRTNGVPNFPDPNSDGDFPDMTPGSFEANAMRQAENTCRKELPPEAGAKPNQT